MTGAVLSPEYFLGSDGVWRAYGRNPIGTPGAGAHALLSRVRGQSTYTDAGGAGAGGGSGVPILPAWPSAANTGARAANAPGGVFTQFTGQLFVNTAGRVVQNMEISQGIATNAAGINLTVKNCLIHCDTAYFGIDSNATGLVVQDCTFIGGKNTNACIGDAGHGSFYRCDISGSQDGVKLSSNSIIQDCYIHDLAPYDPVVDTHNDGIQFQDYHDIIVRHNRVAMVSNDTSALLMGGGEARPPATNVLVELNLWSGAGWTCYGPQGANSPAGPSSNIRFINNSYSTIPEVGGLGPFTSWEAGVGNVFSGNVWIDGPNAGQPVNF